MTPSNPVPQRVLGERKQGKRRETARAEARRGGERESTEKELHFGIPVRPAHMATLPGGTHPASAGAPPDLMQVDQPHAAAAPLEEKHGASIIQGSDPVTGHVISTTIGGKNGEPKRTISYMAERVVGTGSFGIVFQAKCLETCETVAIKKVLQDKHYKNTELQIMRSMDHCNVISLKHCFFSTTSRDELFLNLVMEFVPESLYRVLKHYSNMKQRMPLIYVKLYVYRYFVV